MSTHAERLQRARLSLEGLSVGDSFGGFFELGKSALIKRHFESRQLFSPPWRWTDDTNMALSIYSILRQYQSIEQDKLAQNFALHFNAGRGYGMGARALMVRMKAGKHWREVAEAMFEGGSFGNGGAMRVAPIGAYFADDIEAAVENAGLSSEITHAHPEGIAGTIAIAVASAHAYHLKVSAKPIHNAFIEAILPHIPESDVKAGCIKARDLPQDTTVEEAVKVLGNGSRVIAQDTVPFVIWCAANWLDNYEEAIWHTMSGGGDVDTTCAMVGGIVAVYVGQDSIPEEWIERREALPDWAFEEVD